MAEEYDNNNSGLVFASDAAWLKANPKRPCLKGSVEVDHVKYDMAVFDLHKTSKNGNRMFSVRFQPVEDPNNGAATPSTPQPPAEAGEPTDEENLPF